MPEEYFKHLMCSLEKRMSVIRCQVRKSDIEPKDYKTQIETWFDKINELVNESPPEFYVCELKVFQRAFDVECIQYVYFEKIEELSITGITICKI